MYSCAPPKGLTCALEAFLPFQPSWSSFPTLQSGQSPAVQSCLLLKGLSWESGDFTPCLSPHWSPFLQLPLQSMPPKSTNLLQPPSISNLASTPHHLVCLKYKLCSLARRLSSAPTAGFSLQPCLTACSPLQTPMLSHLYILAPALLPPGRICASPSLSAYNSSFNTTPRSLP